MVAKLTSSSRIESQNKRYLRKRRKVLKDSGDPNNFLCQEFHIPQQILHSKIFSRQKEMQSVRFACQRFKILVGVWVTRTWPSLRRKLTSELWKKVAKSWEVVILTSKRLRVCLDRTPPWQKTWQNLCLPIVKPSLWKDFPTSSKKMTLEIDLDVLEKLRPSGLPTIGKHNSRKASRTFSLKLMSQPKMPCWKWMGKRWKGVSWR